MNDFECKSKAMALNCLGAIAESSRGKQQKALLAVKTWLTENVPAPFGPETLQKLRDVFESETEAERLGREWWDRGSRKVNGEWVSTEPENGAEWKCVWNAKIKRWEPPCPPPLISRPDMTLKTSEISGGVK
jgi:hypothetical protein